MKTQHILPLLLLIGCFAANAQSNQTSADLKSLKLGTNGSDPLASYQLEMTNAYQRVLQIVNRPVKAYKRTKDMQVWKSSPGWFHEGAIEPDYNNVDVRLTQQLVYADHKYQTSDLNPGIVFIGSELEFNAMTKIFYTNRSLPKCRLTEEQMLEINQLYRIIGRCKGEIARLASNTK